MGEIQKKRKAKKEAEMEEETSEDTEKCDTPGKNPELKSAEDMSEDKEETDKEEAENEDLEKAEDEEEVTDSKGRKWKRVKEEPEEEKMQMKAGIEQNPEQSATEGADATHSTTARPVIGNTPHTLMPPTQIGGDRLAVGMSDSPSNVSYSGKSVSPDLLKSPLYQELKTFEKAIQAKLASVEKSVTDRIANLSKNAEKFYSQPMYKAIAENVNPEAIESRTISKQLEAGKIRVTD